MITEGITSPTFFVNSLNKESGTDGNFDYKLNISQSNNFDQICLTKALIPKTWTTINQYNNTFTLDEDSVQTVITIPNGNYNAYDFAKVLSDLLTANSKELGFGIIYAVYFDQPTFKYKIVVDAATFGLTNVSIIFGTNPANKILGFAPNTTNNFSASVDTFYGVGFFGIDSTQQVNFQFTKNVTIKSSMAYDTGRVGGDTTVLARVPVSNTKDGGFVEYEMAGLETNAMDIVNNSKLINFSLHDDEDRIIDFDESYVQFTIILFKHNRHTELAIQSIIADNLDKMRT